MAKQKKDTLPLDKRNYQLMVGGILLLIIGFTIITLDNQPYGFGFLGLTLGPIIVMAGFVIEFFAIFYSSKNNK